MRYEPDVIDAAVSDMKSVAKKMQRKGKKQKKYNSIIGEDYTFQEDDYYQEDNLTELQPQEVEQSNLPTQLILDARCDPGFFFGAPSVERSHGYVGMPLGTEGHIAIIGGNGSGKSAGIAKPTLQTWKGALCVTDVKGELSDFYARLYRQGLVTRPYLIFDPLQLNGISYDPFAFLLQDGEDNLIGNIWEIALAIFPILPDDKQPFWVETERAVFSAALLYYFQRGYGFSEAILKIMVSTTSALCTEVMESNDRYAQMFLGEVAAMKDETIANVDRGIRNKLVLFAADPYISNAFRGVRGDAICFTWDDLEKYNIFLRIPENCIEQWGGAINLIYTQLIRHLERRPDKYSPEGANTTQTLLLMDEFARFGKLEMITNALATLRSKCVNICLIVQSVAQLDRIYGANDRRIIFDNCQFKAILRADDPETQKMLSELIGTYITVQRSVSKNLDEFMDTTGYSKSVSEIRELLVQPHELSTLKDTLLLTPYGFFRAAKVELHDERLYQPEQPITIRAIATRRG